MLLSCSRDDTYRARVVSPHSGPRCIARPICRRCRPRGSVDQCCRSVYARLCDRQTCVCDTSREEGGGVAVYRLAVVVRRFVLLRPFAIRSSFYSLSSFRASVGSFVCLLLPVSSRFHPSVIGPSLHPTFFFRGSVSPSVGLLPRAAYFSGTVTLSDARAVSSSWVPNAGAGGDSRADLKRRRVHYAPAQQ